MNVFEYYQSCHSKMSIIGSKRDMKMISWHKSNYKGNREKSYPVQNNYCTIMYKVRAKLTFLFLLIECERENG